MPMLEEEAKKRQGTRTDLTSGKKFPQVERGRPSEHASKIFQVNERYIREVKRLKEEGKDSIIEELRAGTKTISEAKKRQLNPFFTGNQGLTQKVGEGRKDRVSTYLFKICTLYYIGEFKIK